MLSQVQDQQLPRQWDERYSVKIDHLLAQDLTDAQRRFHSMMMHVQRKMERIEAFSVFKVQLCKQLKFESSVQTMDLVEPSILTQSIHKQTALINEHIEQMKKAPWTIQRLSELILYPRRSYDDLGSYLNAVQKVIIGVQSIEFHNG